MEVLFERAAGLDIGKATLTVRVRTPGPRGQRVQTRTISTMTRSLEAMRDWLLADGVSRDDGVDVDVLEPSLPRAGQDPALPCPMPDHGFMTAAEVAEYLGVSITDVKKLVVEGRLQLPIE